jgi:hypothetical protein
MKGNNRYLFRDSPKTHKYTTEEKTIPVTGGEGP